MKIRNKNISSIDWSEFHVWSPNGVYKRLKVDTRDSLVDLDQRPNYTKSVLITYGFKLRKSLYEVGIGPRPRPIEKTPGKPMESHHHHHSHKHGLVEEAYVHLFAGALGGSTATYMTHWLDTIKVKMQTKPGLYPGGLNCLSQTVQGDGIRGLYKGAVPAVMGQACKTAVVFMSYGLCEELVRRATGCEYIEDMTIWHHAGSGAMTGVVASFVLCPLELLKCRLQAISQIAKQYKSNEEKAMLRSMSSLKMVRYVLRKEGVTGLYRGLPGIWVKEVPGSFIYFGSYEFAKYTMRSFSEKDHLSRRAVFLCGMYAGLCFCVTHPIESVKTRVQVLSAVSQTKGFLRAFIHILKTEGFLPLCSGLGPSMIRACLYSGIQFVAYETISEFFLNDDEDD